VVHSYGIDKTTDYLSSAEYGTRIKKTYI